MLQARRVANCGLQQYSLAVAGMVNARRASQSAAPSGLGPGHVRPLSWEVEKPSRPTTTLWEPSMTLTLHLYSFQQREMDQRMADAPANPK
jgi:hypothetical protein